MARPPRQLKPQPLWVRVDQNRVKLATFVMLFVAGSAALLSLALVAVPGAMIGWASAYLDVSPPSEYFPWLALWVGVAFLAMLVVGAFLAAVQLSNAQDWVTVRFKTRMPSDSERTKLDGPMHDMSLAAGLAAPPEVRVLPSESVNALAIGTTRKRPLVAVTTGLLGTYSEAEVRAVLGTLVARIAAGDILFGTALAALMGPLRALREFRRDGADADAAGAALGGCLDSGPVPSDGCGCAGDGCLDALGGSDEAGAGCLAALAVVVFVAVTAALTYAAVLTAAWIVTLWGRVLHRTSYEKADGEGMLLLKNPTAAMSALGKAIVSENDIAAGDVSYDGIFYVSTSGTPRVERVERRRIERLAEVLGPDGVAALRAAEQSWPTDADGSDG